MDDSTRKPFRGFQRPTYTPIPDELIDEHLPDFTGAELKVLLYICRRTFGFKKESDNISLQQLMNGIKNLDRGTGLTKKTLLTTLDALEDRGFIVSERRQSREKGNEPTNYRLRFVGEKSTHPLVESLHQGLGNESIPGARRKDSPTQETVNKKSGTYNEKDRAATLRRSAENVQHGSWLEDGRDDCR